jgi:hypothetical protein
MTFKKKVKSKFKSFLRRLGLLCKKPTKTTRRIRISRTLNSDGTVTVYDSPVFQVAENPNIIESEIHVFLEEKKLSNPKCQFDSSKKSCICGKSLEDFLEVGTGNCKPNK